MGSGAGGENIQNILISEFNKNNLIDLCWSSITSRIENETLKNVIKSEVLKKWISIWGNAFVGAWVDTVRKGQFEKQRQNKKIVSKKREGTLRCLINQRVKINEGLEIFIKFNNQGGGGGQNKRGEVGIAKYSLISVMNEKQT